VVLVFMIKIFYRVVVKHYEKVSEQSTQVIMYNIIPFHTSRQALNSLHRGRTNINKILFHSNPFITILQDKLDFSVSKKNYVWYIFCRYCMYHICIHQYQYMFCNNKGSHDHNITFKSRVTTLKNCLSSCNRLLFPVKRLWVNILHAIHAALTTLVAHLAAEEENILLAEPTFI